MAPKIMLAPNPHRAMLIDRVIIVGRDEDRKQVVVLSVDELDKNPDLLRRYGSSYPAAIKFWRIVGGVIFLGMVALSFFWRWWAFIIGLIAGIMVLKANRQSTADFAMQIIADNRAAIDHFNELGLIWVASEDSVVPAG
jgi:hypothetical protein